LIRGQICEGLTMSEHDRDAVTGEVFDESTEITLSQLCEVCSVEHTLIERLVDEGVLDPVGTQSGESRFRYTSVRITFTVIRLQEDLGVNLAGAALALELLERIEELQRQVRIASSELPN
jgi:chaperone modulatory protein CbpM